MEPFRDADFRNFYHRFVYIDCRQLVSRIIEGRVPAEITGVIAYGYIDDQDGLVFRIAAFASYRKDTVSIVPGFESTVVLRRGSLSRYTWRSLEDMDLSRFADFAKEIRREHDTKNPDCEKIRTFRNIDSCRHPYYPDDIDVFLVHDVYPPEQVWVRSRQLRDGQIYGELLNEPEEDFGVHSGDMIPIVPQEEEDAQITICVSHAR